jgi:hypothetical protein
MFVTECDIKHKDLICKEEYALLLKYFRRECGHQGWFDWAMEHADECGYSFAQLESLRSCFKGEKVITPLLGAKGFGETPRRLAWLDAITTAQSYSSIYVQGQINVSEKYGELHECFHGAILGLVHRESRTFEKRLEKDPSFSYGLVWHLPHGHPHKLFFSRRAMSDHDLRQTPSESSIHDYLWFDHALPPRPDVTPTQALRAQILLAFMTHRTISPRVLKSLLMSCWASRRFGAECPVKVQGLSIKLVTPA